MFPVAEKFQKGHLRVNFTNLKYLEKFSNAILINPPPIYNLALLFSIPLLFFRMTSKKYLIKISNL